MDKFKSILSNVADGIARLEGVEALEESLCILIHFKADAVHGNAPTNSIHRATLAGLAKSLCLNLVVDDSF